MAESLKRIPCGQLEIAYLAPVAVERELARVQSSVRVRAAVRCGSRADVPAHPADVANYKILLNFG
ncbi:MAG: hypothetical protein CMN21_16670, partial [Rubinisphaera sp.]|uniref:hypothetical protein n=1 Tax=Rubinisphaera sp. TaxID=2024857 RepID=UPI000C0F0AF6